MNLRQLTLLWTAATALLAACASTPTCEPLATTAPAPAPQAAAPAAVAVAAAPAAEAAVPASAAASSADAALREALIGTWVVAKTSDDYSRQPAREEYRADGTYRLRYFTRPDCVDVMGEVEATWQIEHGQLVMRATRVSDSRFGKAGDLSIDEIVSLQDGVLKLKPASRGILGWMQREVSNVRQKSDGCHAA